MKTKSSIRLALNSLKMPFVHEFICYEDHSLELTAKFKWKSGSIVESIDFSLKNKPGNSFGLHRISKCPPDGKVFFRMNIIENPQTPDLQRTMHEVLDVDMAKGNRMVFLFNRIVEKETDYYEQNKCEFSDRKKDDKDIIQSKDGIMIGSI